MPLSRRIRWALATSILMLLVGSGFLLRQDLAVRRAVSGFPGKPLACLTRHMINGIRSDPRGGLVVAYSACRGELSIRLANFDFDEWGLKAVFAVLGAHAMAPYGGSAQFELQALLRERQLDCDNYAALAGHFIQILLPDHPNTFAIVGLDGGRVGNHA